MVNFAAFKNVECKECGKDYTRETNTQFCPDCRNKRGSPNKRVTLVQKQAKYYACILNTYQIGDIFNIKAIHQKCNPENWSIESCRSRLKDLIDQGFIVIIKRNEKIKDSFIEYQIIKKTETNPNIA